jgi:hypothetical protein
LIVQGQTWPRRAHAIAIAFRTVARFPFSWQQMIASQTGFRYVATDRDWERAKTTRMLNDAGESKRLATKAQSQAVSTIGAGCARPSQFPSILPPRKSTMSKLLKLIFASVVVASVAAPITVQASQTDSVTCSVAISYVLNGSLRESYQKDFVVAPTAPISDDFSTFTRFKFFDASTRRESGASVVDISYYSDVGVFDSIDFRTKLTLRDDKASETASGSHTYFASLGLVGEHTTNYNLTCQRLKQ